MSVAVVVGTNERMSALFGAGLRNKAGAVRFGLLSSFTLISRCPAAGLPGFTLPFEHILYFSLISMTVRVGAFVLHSPPLLLSAARS
jgi:hypothetical protein